MSILRAYDQVDAPTYQMGVGNLPAGSTLRRVKLTAYTWYWSTNVTATIQNAPPNTLMGVSWRAAGVGPELITTSNWKDATWYVAGIGTLLNRDRWAEYDTSTTPEGVFVNEAYSQELEIEYPNFNAASMAVGVSLNWLGSGYWANNQVWLTYDLTAWFS